MTLKSDKIISTIKDQVYGVIKENILNGTLRPGQRIQEVEIAKDLSVSRSPVRSAINQLIGEGLLESIPNTYVCVRKLSEKDIVDAYEFRVVVEKYATEKVCTKLNDEIRSQLRQFRQSFLKHVDSKDIPDYLEVDSAFHDYIVNTSGNRVIVESLHRVSMMIVPFRVFALSGPNRFIESIDEHVTLIDALLEGDVEKSVKACVNHLTITKEKIIKHLRISSYEDT